MFRVGPFHLGWCFLPSKVVSDTSFLGRLLTDLAKMTQLLKAIHANLNLKDQVYSSPSLAGRHHMMPLPRIPHTHSAAVKNPLNALLCPTTVAGWRFSY